jgi:GT2 family glycosyltransferase
MAQPRVSVIVLSYDRPHLLARALESIAAQTYPVLDVVVVDNHSASSDRIQEIVRSFGVRLIANLKNRGFTGGMNQGLSAAAGEYVYLTEDDIELAPDCVELLVDYLATHSDVALAGPIMWNRHTPTIRCAGGTFALGSIYRMQITAAGDSAAPSPLPFETMFLPGAMIAARTATLRALGGFRSEFFMYREDVELCARVLKRGHRIAIVPAAKVFHHEPPNAADSPTVVYHKHKNLGAVYFLHAPLAVLPLYVLRYAGVDGLRRIAGNRSAFLPWLGAWMWLLWRAPMLLAERRRT